MTKPADASQIQSFSDQRVRPRAEQIRNLYLACKDDIAAIGDVYAALTGDQSSWTDQRQDNPPHLLSASDILAWNTFITGLIALVESGSATTMQNAGPQYPVVLSACIRAPGS